MRFLLSTRLLLHSNSTKIFVSNYHKGTSVKASAGVETTVTVRKCSFFSKLPLQREYLDWEVANRV